MAFLEADSIVHSYDGTIKILSDVFLKCETGEIAGLLGRNGSGKTTLLKIIFGIIEPISGIVRIDGEYIPLLRRKFHISYLPQTSCLPRDITVGKCIRLYLSKQKAADLVMINPRLQLLLSQKVASLSGGELRFVETLLVLSLDSQFVLLDEPFSRIEPIYIEGIKQLIRIASKTKGILLTDHNYQDLLDVASTLFLIKGGKLFFLENERSLIKYGYIQPSGGFPDI